MRSILLLTLFITSLPAFVHAEQMRRLDYNAPKESAPPLFVPKPKEAKEPSEKVWERYKALAAGQPEDEQKEEQKIAEQAPAAKPTGISDLLQQYQSNKESRAGMRSMQVEN